MTTYQALGYRFEVSTDVPRLQSTIEHLYAAYRIASGPVDAAYVLRRREKLFEVERNGEQVLSSYSPGPLLDQLLWDVHNTAVERCEPLVLHAAAASRQGRGILISGPPDAGKTTLVAGLVVGGCDYLTDEAAVVDSERGIIQPYPRPLWIEPPSIGVIPGLDEDRIVGREFMSRWFHVCADDLRRGSVGGPCRAELIILTRYEPGAPTELVPIRRGEALVALIDQSFNMDRHGGAGLRVLRNIVAGAECYRLRSGDLAGAVAAILDAAEAKAGAVA